MAALINGDPLNHDSFVDNGTATEVVGGRIDVASGRQCGAIGSRDETMKII